MVSINVLFASSQPGGQGPSKSDARYRDEQTSVIPLIILVFPMSIASFPFLFNKHVVK
jgi:hypothetical protein